MIEALRNHYFALVLIRYTRAPKYINSVYVYKKKDGEGLQRLMK